MNSSLFNIAACSESFEIPHLYIASKRKIKQMIHFNTITVWAAPITERLGMDSVRSIPGTKCSIRIELCYVDAKKYKRLLN